MEIEGTLKQRFLMVLQAIFAEARAIFVSATQASFELYKIMIPLLILTRILEGTGAINLLGSLLKPIMGIVNLPGNMGFVWATSLIVGTYGALLVLISFIASNPLTVAQMTILLSMCLIAHSLPVEAMVARKA
ncbi:MAG: nucleoside recognition domain-containing protein, partial [Anaerolineales bacterium]